MVDIIRSSDSKVAPDGYAVQQNMAELQLDNATGVVLTTPTTATVVADAANGWTAGLIGGLFSATTGSVTATTGAIVIPKAGNYRVTYSLSGITVVTTQVITTEIYKGSLSAGAGTASKGKCVVTQLTGAPVMVSASVLLTSLVIGDIISLKVIASTGNFGAKQGFLRIEEV